MSTNVYAPYLSVVTTLYRSESFIHEFLRGCRDSLREIECDNYEVVMVNDGSPDDSLRVAMEIKRTMPQLVLVDFSRNFGHHHAIHAGLLHARGELVFLIDCDLEVSPSVLKDFYLKQRRTGSDLVFGYQEQRKGRWFEKTSGAIFWRAFNLLSDTKVPENMLTERLMTRRFLDSLLSLGDSNLFLGGMMCWTGFDQVGLPVSKSLRDGQSTYTPLKRFQLMVDAVSSFSSRPLTVMFYSGISITMLSIVYLSYLAVRKMWFNDTLLGFTSLMGIMTLSLGILTTGLGVLGIYLGKMFNQVRSRPRYIVKEVYR